MRKIFQQVLFFLLLITILAVVLRFYKLGEIPMSLSWDEAAQGYNAYSLGITGKDEFGRFLPLDYLESFGDFKPVLYTYTALLSVKVFGLNEFATRFPSAFFGTLTVFLVFFLVNELFFRQKNKQIIALLSSFFLAISPWHIQMSRAAYEANLGLFEVVLGIWLFMKGFRDKSKYLILSAVPFSLVFYTFNSTRAFLPFFLLSILLLYSNRWQEKRYYLFAFIFVFQLCLIAVTPHLLSPQAALRFKEVNIFSDIKPIEISNQRMSLDGETNLSKIVHNRRWMFFQEFLRHYLDNLNFRFLFLNGDPNPKFSLQDVGQEYLLHLPFFLLGLLFAIRLYSQESKLIFLWLFIGLLPAATARETPHALRILQTLPLWQIIIALGIYHFFASFKFKKYILIIYVFLLIFNFTYYLHNYYSHYPKEFAGEWQYGYKEAVQFSQENYSKYDRIVITDSIGRPYIYVLFYAKYSPLLFKEKASVERDAFGFVKIKSFDKYIFGGPEINKPEIGKKTLYFVSSNENLTDRRLLKNINLPNGRTVLKVYED